MKLIINLLLLVSFAHFGLHAADETKLKTNFGECPNHPSGKLSLKILKVFSDSKSLWKVKEVLEETEAKKNYFIQKYKLAYEPVSKTLSVDLTCFAPMAKVQVYNNSGANNIEGILLENGEIVDPTYEVFLKSDKKIEGELPLMAVTFNQIKSNFVLELAKELKELPAHLKRKMSEIILDNENNMTLLFSVNNLPVSTFLGDEEFPSKFQKLSRLINYLSTRNKIPRTINMTNSKKVVVKF